MGVLVCLVIYKMLRPPAPTLQFLDLIEARIKGAWRYKNSTISRPVVLRGESWTGANPVFKSKITLRKGLIPSFDQAPSLLVLGTDGIGKTRLLLELANELITRSLEGQTQSIPVFLNLSSYRGSLNFQSWLISAIALEYGIPKSSASALVASKQFILLLDGLDEVPGDQQQSCVNSINEYLKLPIPGIVVCSRYSEYLEIGLRLNLVDTILLTSLTNDQILDHVNSSGKSGKVLGTNLRANPALLDLARRPLFLNLCIKLVDHIGRVASKSDVVLSHPAYVKRLFDTFVWHQLFQKSLNPLAFSRQRIVESLSWLAHAKNETVVFVEQFQPDWLGRVSRKRGMLLFLYTLCSRVAGTTAIMTVGIGMMYLSQALGSFIPGDNERYGLIGVEQDLGKWFVITSAVGGLIATGIDHYRFRHPRTTPNSWHSEAISILRNVALCVTVFAVISNYVEVSNPAYGSLMYGLALGLVIWFRGQGLTTLTDIRISERLMWSFKKFLRGLLWGAAAGSVLGAMAGIVTYLSSGIEVSRNVTVLVFLTAVLLGGVINGLQRSREIDEWTIANRGLKLAGKNAIFAAISVAGPFAFLFWSYGLFASGRTKAVLESGLFFAIVVGIIIGFSYGGLDVLYHYVLRLFLWFEGFRVLRYKEFFECVATLNFLERNSGGYKFFHETLAEYLVQLSPEQIKLLGNDSGLDALPPPPFATTQMSFV